MAYYGIDVSYHEGEIDWSKAAANCLRFCFVRAGYNNQDGSITVDQRFAENAAGSIETGLDTGLYLYSYARTPEASRASALRLIEMAQDYELTMPLVLDLEDVNVYQPLGREGATAVAAAFLETVEEAGYYAMLYSNTYFANNYLNMSQLADYDFWVADYTDWLSYTGAYGIWQYTDRGVIDGIEDRVDLNITWRDYPSVIRGAGLNHLPGSSIKKGSRVCIRSGATVYARSGADIPASVKCRLYTVGCVRGNAAFLCGLNEWVYLRDLCLKQA